MIFWSFCGIITFQNDSLSFFESLFQLQIKLISYQSEFWDLRRKSGLIFKNGYFFKILWWSHEPHNNVSSLTIMDFLLSLFQPTLVSQNFILLEFSQQIRNPPLILFSCFSDHSNCSFGRCLHHWIMCILLSLKTWTW